ncbi:PIN domain-containing protein [Candidatus Thiosymbion oneisti]|uniref:PIN domain-containing protein n=1 Tax=Candidatus Thiosymbion oneisti TaxID=589554 RepID=UPI00105ECA5A|nr:PIN domain-containing protein [Candidatus Thiosymbion oneisti]
MAAERWSLDTNILVYAIDCDTGEKHRIAVELLDALAERDCVLSLQVLAEFFHVVTRKGHVPAVEAMGIVNDWSILFPVVAAEGRHLQLAMDWVGTGTFSFWDGLLFATINGAKATRLLTEDMQHGFEKDRTRIINPYNAEFGGTVSAILES